MLEYHPFKLAAACKALETLARQQDRSSPELGAIELSAHALLFIFAPVPPDGHLDSGGMEANAHAMHLTWSSQGPAFMAYLSPWLDTLRKRATDEQGRFLKELGLDGIEDTRARPACSAVGEDEEVPPGHDLATRPHAKILPELAHGVSILERLVQRYDPSTSAYSCLELAAKSFRFLLDTNQVNAFCTDLDKGGVVHSPTGDG
jgi:hypothetical protein